MKQNQFGRSMIEMLGVLAIIGVLSVGGIAGYSKAMEKFRINKVTEEYTYILQSLLEHKDNIIKNNPNYQVFLTGFMKSINIVPNNWNSFSEEGTINGFHDSYGNDVYFYTTQKILAMDIYLGGESRDSDNNRISQGFSDKLCLNLLQNFIQPLHNVVSMAGIGKWGTGPTNNFYGNAYCSSENKCLQSATLTDLHNACKKCTDGYCGLYIRFN